jgi:predicted transcriptional regulator
MTDPLHEKLSRLERRIMDAVYLLSEAPVADVVTELGEEDAYDSVRVTMANLEKKGFLEHRREGTRNVYRPTISERKARTSAMKHLLRTFFDGSPSNAILEFLKMSKSELTEAEIADIRARIEAAEQDDVG